MVERGERRAKALSTIARGSIPDGEAALAQLEAVGGHDDADVLELAELYRTRWESAKPHTVRVIESFAATGGGSRIGEAIAFPDPDAVRGDLARELARGRELYRRAIDFHHASLASVLLGDAAGLDANLLAEHRAAQTHASRTYVGEPSPDEDGVGVELAFAGSTDVDAAVDRMLARSAGMRPAYIATEACMANVARAYVAERAGHRDLARALYDAVPAGNQDDCFRTAAARRIPLAGVDATTHVSGAIAVPPNTVVRLAFQAVPPIAPGETPGLFGTGTSIRHPLPAREEYFYLDATIADGKLDVDLPPGTWLPQIELDPAGRWTLGDVAPCLSARSSPLRAHPDRAPRARVRPGALTGQVPDRRPESDPRPVP